MLLTVVLPILIRSAALLSVALEVLTRLWVHLLLGAASLFWSPLATLLDFCGWQRDEELSSADDGGLRTAALDPRVEGSFVFSNSAFEPSSSEDSSEAVSSEPSEDTAVLLLLRQGSTKKGSPRALVLQRGMSGIGEFPTALCHATAADELLLLFCLVLHTCVTAPLLLIPRLALGL